MIFSPPKPQASELEQSSLVRIVGLLLEGCALHAVEFNTEEHNDFRLAIRDVRQRFEQASDPRDLLVLVGEANKTMQSYGQSLEKYLRVLTTEKHLAIKLLSESLLRVCHTSEESAQALRNIEGELKKVCQVEDMRTLRGRLAVVVDGLCKEAERQEEQYNFLKASLSGPATTAHDAVTGLPTLKHAEARIKKVASSGHTGFVLAFFLKNVDVVNRRFGFDSGDDVLRRFAAHLAKNLDPADELFRWRGPCFVVLAQRLGQIETFRAEADKLGARGPEQTVERQGKSMLFRLTAATAVFPIEKTRDTAELSAKIDRFAAEQFKESPAPR